MDIKRLHKNWQDFIQKGVINDDVDIHVAKSWAKCRRNGVNPDQGHGRIVDGDVLSSILEENKTLVEISLSSMENVLNIVTDSDFLLVLTDSAGYVLKTIGSERIAKMASDLRFTPGALWSEQQVGSNAISIALDYDTPIQMIGPEHFCREHHKWTCSAAPIHGIDGEVVGCLDMSGACEDAHPHTLGLIMAATFGIEQQLKSLYRWDLLHSALDANPESILLLNERFHIVWTNKTARRDFKISAEHLAGMDFRQFMPEVDWGKIETWEKDIHYSTQNTSLIIGSERTFCSVEISSTIYGSDERAFSVNIKRQDQIINSVNVLSGNRAQSTFNDILAKNPTMKKTLAMAQRFARYNGNILIEGEVGTGKSLFAQAMHNGSEWSDGPFVVVNCASLQRNQVGSVLFGLEKGTEQKISDEGYLGKFELANHGTIFLDEIGELPLEYQGELLEVVQSHRVKKIGGVAEKEIDVRIIAATSIDLRKEVDLGHFRGDLFYLLNVLKLDIPPLRERPEDISLYTQHFLDHFNDRNPEMRKKIDAAFLDAIEHYLWPGNVKELRNSLERAFYASTGVTLQVDELRGIIGSKAKSSLSASSSMLTTLAAQGRFEVEEYHEIVSALQAWNYNVPDASAALRMSRASLYRRINQLGINLKVLRRRSLEVKSQ
ncbi:MAG: sigma 54-interacting transcriptional regulator [Coriobacteriales bacterium]|jgi:transcriptional regulator of acetoin/glycerol metabolism|nr:sigma 54-interacting transcriptional regulator [Coriobacteriales bacterium]